MNVTTPEPVTAVRRRGTRRDLVAVAAAVVLVVVAHVRGESLKAAGVDVFLGLPPLLAAWAPHVGPGTPAAVAVAVAVVTRGPDLAARLAWRPLLLLGYAASARPYTYFVWANLAALVLALGPAVVAGLRRFLTGRLSVPLGVRAAAVVLGGAGAIALADLSGLSKAEVERIWLPFAIWLVVSCAALPRPRAWLAAQAALALAVNHLLITVW